MDALWQASWRSLPATSLAVVGVCIAVRAVWRQRAAIALGVTDARCGAALARALRGVLGGLALAAFGLAWAAQWSLVAIVAATIGLEETWETSVVIAALDDAERRGAW